MSDVAVVIPCYNAEAWISETLRSVFGQTLAPTEVVVADDGSTDGSLDVLDRFGDRVRIVRGPHGGAGPARMAGYAETSAPLVMFLDADDVLGPDVLEHLTAAVRSGGLSRCDWRRYELLGEAWIAPRASCAPRAPWQDDLSAWLTGWYCPPCCVLWTRKGFEKTGGWTTAGLSNDDGDLMMRALTAQLPFEKAPGGLSYYRRLPGEGTLSGKRLTPEGLRARMSVIDGVGERLDADGRKKSYAVPLTEAYTDIKADAVSLGDAEIVESTTGRISALGQSVALAPAAAVSRRRAGYLALRRPPMANRLGTECLGPPRDRSVTVVIPTHNRADDTVRAVRSALSQSHEDLHVIVVDDASTDETAAQVEAVDDPRLTVLRQPANAGVAAARNRGLAEACGAFVAFLDSDDEWRPEKVAKQVDALAASDGAALASCATIRRSGGAAIPSLPTMRGQDAFPDLLRRNEVGGGGSSVLMRREVYDRIGGFDETLPAAEDWDYWLRASRFFGFVAVTEPLLIYDDEPSPERRSRAMRANMTARDMIHERYRQDMREHGAESDFLMESARRELSEPAGDAGRGRRAIVRAALAGGQGASLLPWLGYMVAPAGLRQVLRRIDDRETARTVG